MVSIETAIGSATLIIITSGLIGVLATVGAHLAAVDQAGAAARAHAIGEAYQAQRGTVHITEDATYVTAVAEVPAVFGTQRATAVFPREVLAP